MGAMCARAPAGVSPPVTMLLLAAALAACGVRSPGARAYPELADVAGREIEAVRFLGAGPFPADTLADLTETEPTRGNLLGLPIHLFGLGLRREYLNLDRLRRDVLRLEAFYRRSGYFGTRVEPAVEPVDDRVAVDFVISLGQPIRVAELTVTGTAGILDPDSLRRELPLQPGELFDLGEFAASAEELSRALQERGYAYAEVLRDYDLDRLTALARAGLTAVPGPRVVVDSIIVLGAENLGRRATLRQLTFRQGDLLRRRELVESQRNLYSLEIVQFATVAIAEDTLQVAPQDSTRATVTVRISEGPVHVVEAAAGFGTVDCLRGEVEWVSRSFGGGARRLALGARVSKVGIGRGLGGSLCRAFEGDPFRADLDYRFAADFTQPGFLSPRNNLTVSAFAERESEPRVFQRVARGGRVALSRRLSPREILTAAVDVERGRTVATPAIFCVAFLVCLPEDIEELADARWLNSVGANWVRDRRNLPLDPTAGSITRASAAWASSWLGSDIRFVRVTAETGRYREIRPEWVAAFFLRLGSFLGTATIVDPGGNFLPPEERFFAGGAYSVRGFDRNALGPGVYVAPVAETDPETGQPVAAEEDEARFVPIGGTSLLVANAELRVPSFFARDIVRLAFFVDAGAVGAEDLRGFDTGDLRFTPGVGLRVATPIGPVRLDAAYNPYAPEPGPLFVPDPETGALIRVADGFAPERPGFLGRFRLHLAIGQAF